MEKLRSLLGKQGEAHVAQHLEQRGFTILTHNFIRQQGEIDVIARKDDLVVFVEVKTRYTAPAFDMTELIGPTKQKKIIKVAKQFLALHAMMDVAYQFDVALVICNNQKSEICYIPNAFQESG